MALSLSDEIPLPESVSKSSSYPMSSCLRKFCHCCTYKFSMSQDKTQLFHWWWWWWWWWSTPPPLPSDSNCLTPSPLPTPHFSLHCFTLVSLSILHRLPSDLFTNSYPVPFKSNTSFSSKVYVQDFVIWAMPTITITKTLWGFLCVFILLFVF